MVPDKSMGGGSEEGLLFLNWASYRLLGLTEQSKAWDNEETD